MPIASNWCEQVTAAARTKSGFVCKGRPGVAMPVVFSSSKSSPSQLSNNSHNNHDHGHNHHHQQQQRNSGNGNSAEEQVAFTSRCPHVILIGDLFIEDLDTCTLVALQQRRKNDPGHEDEPGDQEEEDEEEEESDENEGQDGGQIVVAKLNRKAAVVSESVMTTTTTTTTTLAYLTCDECDQRKNLWICLRQDCLYVGCGQSNLKHSTNHAQNFHHPLSMNLAKKSVWCEICNRPIVLEQNYPQFRFKSRNKLLVDASDGRLIYDPTTSGQQLENSAHNIMFDRAFEHHVLATSSQSGSSSDMGDLSLVEFLEQDIDPNREAYDKSCVDGSQRGGGAYEDLPVRNGLIGLDNLGNTCYMNSALQALSNCLAFTSFFLECSQFIESIIPNNSGASGASLMSASSSSSTACLSVSYMKLMREIWQKRNSKNKRQMASSISPSELVQTIKYFNAMFRGYSQHDSQEFILYLLDQLHEEMKRPLIALSKVKAQTKKQEEDEGEEDGDDGSEDSNADEDDRTVIQQGADHHQLKVARSDSSTLHDSVSKRPRKKSHHRHHHGGHHGNHGNGEAILSESIDTDHGDSDDESDSYETCGAATSSELSDKLHFSDVEESPHSSMSFDEHHHRDHQETSCSDAAHHEASASSEAAAANEKEDTRQLLDKLDEYRKNRLSNTNTNSSVSNITDTTDSGISTVHSQQDSSSVTAADKSSRPKKNSSNSTSKNKKNGGDQQSPPPPKPDYSSIVSDLFNGQIIGQVQCLECKHLSTTTETFQHLSLPIPSKEYLQALHSKVVNHQNSRSTPAADDEDGDNDDDDDGNGSHRQHRGAEGSGTDEMSSSVPYQSWLSWMVDVMKGYIWSPTIKLSECLTAFFSDDDLKGDNMYSCEKCKKLTNGVKYSKVLNLPEILCVHLKRFRHDSMFATGKVNTYVSFPIDGLEMRPFVHKECKNQYTSYDLCSVICHYGGANGGHYTSYARNYANEEWYEYDDSYCRQVDTLTVQNAQAYVLFYKKRNSRIDSLKEELHNIIFAKAKSNSIGQSLLAHSYYISKQWLHRFKYFSEPGSIDNSDFLCKHNFVQPYLWAKIESLTSLCSAETWHFFVQNFGVKYDDGQDDHDDQDDDTDNSVTNGDSAGARPKTECMFLYPCAQCQLDEEALKQRQFFERTELTRLQKKYQAQLFQMHQPQRTPIAAAIQPPRLFAISMSWFKQWQQFVDSNQQRSLVALIPGKINNFSICVQQNKTTTAGSKHHNASPPVYTLNKNSNYGKISEEMWNFLHGIYGGGPALVIGGAGGSGQSPSSSSSHQSVIRTPQKGPSYSLSSLSLSVDSR